MTQRKKIIHLISSLKIGGAESLLYDLILSLGSADYEHHVIYFHPGPNVERINSLNVSTYHIKGLVSLYDPIFFWRLGSLVKKIKPDLMHSALWAANFSGRIIARIFKIPIVSAIHLGVDIDGTIRNMLDVTNFGWATKIIAVSQGVKKSIEDKGWASDNVITVIPNGIDVDAIVQRGKLQQQTRAELGLHSDHFIIGSVGRFIPRKNYGLLLESFAQLYKKHSHARLVLVGLGPEEQVLRNKADELGVKDVVSFVIGKSAYGYLPLFDCFVLSSHQEGLSIALLEAMCFSLPCIVTSVDGTHEVIQHNVTGFLPQPNSHNLSQTIENIMLDKSLRLHIGNQACKMLKDRFNLFDMIHAYRNVFESVKND